ncbi:unnamed protein product [Eruca vesicaria subsp. sativa]|uniref:GRF-type domain-containing protein n=1 Tax=Eruca vesicaria subsp. sativa TaxID=29727 RepID=A0ABC8M808_ERUVS|nr:unnamed protein product [Eruca vesicaria subsp. sativa]
MSSSDSSSTVSCSHTGRQTVGIPTRCWCGSKLTIFGASTKENLFRRFHCCGIGVKRKTEQHLFKWVDEAIVDKISIVDAKHCHLKADVDSFKSYTTQTLEKQAKHLDDALIQIKRLLDDQTARSGTNNNSISGTDDTLTAKNLAPSGMKPKSPVITIAAAAIALGTMAWLYTKLST